MSDEPYFNVPPLPVTDKENGDMEDETVPQVPDEDPDTETDDDEEEIEEGGEG